MIPPVVRSSRAQAEQQEAIEAAAAQLLIALAFLVPKGTDIGAAIGDKLLAYKNAIWGAAVLAAQEAEREQCEKLVRLYHDGIDGALDKPPKFPMVDAAVGLALKRCTKFLADQIRARQAPASGGGEET